MKYEPAHRAYNFGQAMRQYYLAIVRMGTCSESCQRQYQLKALR
jgi:hypothetical protein